MIGNIMSIKNLAKHKVISVNLEMNVDEIAKIMKEHNIGNVVVVNEDNKPMGIITDRDIIIKVIADGINPAEIQAGYIMTSNILVLDEYTPIQQVLEMMSAKGVRRAPIINSYGILVGIISADDLAILIAEELETYGKLLRKQIIHVNE